MTAWKAIITLESEGLLLGGSRRHVSLPFASKQDAQDFADQAIEVNRNRPEYGNSDITVKIVSCYSNNPIPATERN